MIDEKLLGLLYAAAGAMAGGLVNYGMFKQKMKTLFADVTQLKAEQVKRDDHDDAIRAVHDRITRHSDESDKRWAETQAMLREIDRSLTDFQGYMRGRFDSEREAKREVKNHD